MDTKHTFFTADTTWRGGRVGVREERRGVKGFATELAVEE
jgi:hypothetical protein